ncbi:GntR family transcriptional regulator [Sinorhizobium mexicanum]|nr:DNA-binding GntR family transcriptional regulator [Sinorhizobium mexicanum]
MATDPDNLADKEIPGSMLSSRGGPRGELVYKALLEGIRAGRIRPGDRIREEDVAQSLGVSRTPVREALQQLQARRLVEVAPGRGIVVVELNTQQVMELYAMREVLEGAAARFAAQHALPAEIAMMRELLNEFDTAEGDAAELARINHALHRTIYEAARNRYMHEALNNLEDALSLLQNTTFSLPERHGSASREHKAIVSAIESRDSEGAEAASRLHIREAQRSRLRMLMNR